MKMLKRKGLPNINHYPVILINYLVIGAIFDFQG